MKIVYITHDYVPRSINGLIVSTMEEARLLSAAGHELSVLCELRRKSRLDFYYWAHRSRMKVIGSAAVSTHFDGYPVHRAPTLERSVQSLMALLAPDVALVHPNALTHGGVKILDSLHRHCPRVIIYFHALNSFWSIPGVLAAPMARCCEAITVSHFMANRVKALWNLTSTPFVNFPIIRPEAYRLPVDERGQGEYVLFVNPRPEKGIEIACALAAARPDIPFAFVKTWSSTSKQDASLRERLSNLPNVRMLPSNDDMRPLYRGARLVLAPSANRWGSFFEAWGRVASEAQLSGIPVLASSGHGFDESVGPGGILVPSDAPIKDWVTALSVLWDDQHAYSRFSQAALDYSARDELIPERVMHKFMDYLQQPPEPVRESAVSFNQQG